MIGEMNSEQMVGILMTFLVSTVEEVVNKLFLNASNDVNFQQDSDTEYISWATKNWVASTSISTMN